ncbi:Re/Si-specific NAD(P)(+) transhydrogenase subunit alpha [Bdellovibrionota bacterium]
MKVGIPKETRENETRVAASPESVKKLVKKGLSVCVESSAGLLSLFTDDEFKEAGAEIVDKAAAFGSDIVLKFHPPTEEEISLMKKGALLISFLERYRQQGIEQRLSQAGVNCFAMELLPRISRAQSMDALSSQAGLAGYRAVLEAGIHYERFFPMMMTSAGSAKPAGLLVLGAGVAGLQALATAKRLGAKVVGYDIRPETKEEIESLGAKFLELDIGEEGGGEGGYAKELSEEAKKKQQELFQEALKKFDIIISTASVPGKKAPVLITEDAVKGMRKGSVIVDLAAANGGNCALTEKAQVVQKHGVTIVGKLDYPAMVPFDASRFYSRNVNEILFLMLEEQEGKVNLKYDFEDEIINESLATHNGEIRLKSE